MFRFSFKEAFQSFLLAARASPNHLTRLAIFNLLSGIGPAITLYLLKVIIDGISRSLGLPYTNIWEWVIAHPLFWGSIIGFVAVHLLLDSLETVASFEASSFRDNVVGETKIRIFKKIAEFRDIALFEDSELLNTLQLGLIRYFQTKPSLNCPPRIPDGFLRLRSRIPVGFFDCLVDSTVSVPSCNTFRIRTISLF